MKVEEIREMVQKSIYEQVNQSRNNEQIDESVLGAIAAAGGAIAAFGILRGFIKSMRYKEIFNLFIQEEDSQNVINKKLPRTIKKGSLISSLSDLNQFEEESEEIIQYLERLKQRVEPFIEQSTRSYDNAFDKTFFLNADKEKAEFKREIQGFIDATRKSFERAVDSKRDEVLG